MDDYVETTADNGGVHLSSGIPKRPGPGGGLRRDVSSLRVSAPGVRAT